MWPSYDSDWSLDAILHLVISTHSGAPGRKGFGQEIKEKVTPQESKSTVVKIKETFTGAGDKAQREVMTIRCHKLDGLHALPSYVFCRLWYWRL